MTAPFMPGEWDRRGMPTAPPWQGFTLDDLLVYAQTGQAPRSSVRPGQVGYGLDEVGNANISRPGGDPAPGGGWKQTLAQLVGGALAGASASEPGAPGMVNVGRGYVAAEQRGMARGAEARGAEADALEQAIRQRELEKMEAEAAGRPMETQRKALESEAALDYDRARAAEADAKRREIEQRLLGGYAIDPVDAARVRELEARAGANEALAGQRRALASRYGRMPVGGRGAAPPDREAWIRNTAARLLTAPAYDEYGDRSSRSAEDARAEAEALYEAEFAQPAQPAAPVRGNVTAAQFDAARGGGVKTAISRAEYEAVVADQGADYAARYFTVAR